MKGLVHKHYLSIYRQNIEICFHSETFTRRTGNDTSDCGGMVDFNAKSGLISIFLPKDETGHICVGATAHESFHVADFIFGRAGMVVNEGEGNEHMAYLIGHIIELIFDHLEIDNKMEFGE